MPGGGTFAFGFFLLIFRHRFFWPRTKLSWTYPPLSGPSGILRKPYRFSCLCASEMGTTDSHSEYTRRLGDAHNAAPASHYFTL
jgi:hypothetical protein